MQDIHNPIIANPKLAHLLQSMKNPDHLFLKTLIKLKNQKRGENRFSRTSSTTKLTNRTPITAKRLKKILIRHPSIDFCIKAN